MKLYYAPGACSMASRISLYEIGRDAQFVRTDIRAKRTEDGRDFRELNPLGYVPVLELDGGEVLTENDAILPYIASLAPGRLAPEGDALTQARLHQALGFLSSELHKAFGPFFGNPQGEARAAALDKLNSRLDFVEQHLADGRDYWLGDQFTVADAYAFVVLSWADHFGISYEDRPNIGRYVQRIGGRESVQRALKDEGLLQAA
ncbi:glutathione S-transferase C-terminal domain-containing protein [Sphingomonas sp. BN140010]|uniref:Glutathione S-transferase C-terminal domain-containing protein n=1 Tax=Sphingomonas arvum TaxID=2992113 RepID=A0ABT3JHN0_9SPHN|nr:glutathione S-transferase C-terminal domain-containing protein [Sphingomonas sp. BN140010]MCW3798590.1 glutathione S-transferase C-terminal domain-containing protein [Sphingomonas sp. BN140010]